MRDSIHGRWKERENLRLIFDEIISKREFDLFGYLVEDHRGQSFWDYLKEKKKIISKDKAAIIFKANEFKAKQKQKQKQLKR